MGIYQLTDHLDYLTKRRGLSPATLVNYNYALKRVGIHEVDTDNLPALWTKLEAMLPVRAENGKILSGLPHGYVFNYNGMVCGLLTLRNVSYNSYEYNVFRERLSKMMTNSPEAYTDGEMKSILAASRKNRGWGLYRLLIFLAYTGCRISSAHGVKFSNFRDVPGFPTVMSVPVVGKGRPYPAIISKKAVEQMQFYNANDSDNISGHADTMASSFRSYNTNLLNKTIRRSGLFGALHNTDVTRSIRKWFTVTLANSGMDGDSLSLLLGQVPRSIAFSIYATSKGSTTDRLTARVADAYSKSPLAEMELW